jgi:phenylalanyl-tRNA synthetase alpha chain
VLVSLVDSPQDTTRNALQGVAESSVLADAKQLADFRKRKLVLTTKIIHYSVEKGPKYAKEIPVEVTDLTPEMLESGSWKTANFKPYNFAAKGAVQNAGALHPLNKVREEFRKIFFHQGFVEMPTARYAPSLPTGC